MLALTGAEIFTADAAHGYYACGTVLISEGKIAGVESGISVPDRARQIDLRGRCLLPGFIDAHTHLGIAELATGWEGWDYNELEVPVTPQLRALDAVNPRDEAFVDARRAGITTVGVAPGSIGVIGGEVAVLKTVGQTVEDMLVRKCAGIKAALGENPRLFFGRMQGKSPVTRMAAAAQLREQLLAASYYTSVTGKEGGEIPEFDCREVVRREKKRSLARVLQGELPLRIHAHRPDDIMTALRLAREFEIELVIEHCTAGHLVAEEVAAAGYPVVIGPTMSSRSKQELAAKDLSTPAILQNAGVRVALTCDHPITPIQNLRLVAALAVRAGLPPNEALRAITFNPAVVLGVEGRVGSIEVGKDADIAVFKGRPLEVKSEAVAVFVGGRIVDRGRGCLRFSNGRGHC